MTWRAALVLLLLLVPAGEACTSTRGPFQSVRFVATEEGRTILDVPTSIQVGPSGLCGWQGPPTLAFDGRFAAWAERGGMDLRVVDVTTGTQTIYTRGVLTQGHLALLGNDGLRPNVTLVDLHAGTSQVVEAPEGQSFVANFEGAVVAKDMGWSGTGDRSVSVLDPVNGTWLLQGAALSVPSPDTYTGSRDWIVFGSGDNVRALEVSTGTTSLVAQANGTPAAVHGDRLYLYTLNMNSMGWYTAPHYWSVLLPSGTDRLEGAMPATTTQGNRTVAFVTQGTDTNGPTTTSPAATTTDDATGTSEADEIEDEDDSSVWTVPSAQAWVILAAVLGAAMLMRRRLR